MDLTASIDAYCERIDAGFWSEPVNALTNAAFLLAAVIMWRRTAGLPVGRVLSAVLFAIGVGSFLFHTLATVWASLADTTPIALFILIYVYAANRTFWGWQWWTAAMGAAFVVPWAAIFGSFFGQLPFFRISAPYWPVLLLIVIYAGLFHARRPGIARGLAIGAMLLAVSLTARSVDGMVCDALPLGTHWLWHCLNAVMLGWMIEVWRRAEVAAGRT